MEEEILEQEELNILEQFPSLKTIEYLPDGERRNIKSFVLRGQRLKPWQIEGIKTGYEKYCIPFTKNKISWENIFGNNNPVVIEIGFGMGESTLKIAKNNPNINYLGIEVFLYGFSKLLANIQKEEISNIKIMRFDAKQVMEYMVPDCSVSGFHIFFPDPWQKKKHHKRRLLQPPFSTLLAKKLIKTGYIYAVSDWEDYSEQILNVLSNTPSLINNYEGYSKPIPWRPDTSFERKGLEKNHPIREIWVEKI